MAPTNQVSLADLRTQVRQRADMENSQFVTDPELTTYINQSAFELYDLLVAAYGDDYYMTIAPSFVSDGISDTYPLPDDLYKLLGVDISANGQPGTWRPLMPFGINERNRAPWGIPGSVPAPVFADPQYRLRSNSLWFEPLPAGGQYLRTLYIPRMTKLVADGDLLDGVSGWDEYVIVDAAIKCKTKEQTDTQELQLAKMTLKARIDNMKRDRNAGQPKTTQRTRRNLWGQDVPGFPGGRGPWGF